MKIIFVITKPISGIVFGVPKVIFGIGKMTPGMTHARRIVPLVMMRGDFPGLRCTGDARPGGEGQFWEDHAPTLPRNRRPSRTRAMPATLPLLPAA
jgi:hypothetical protein